MRWAILALGLLSGGREARALTPQSCAASNACLCGEWTGAIWAWRKFGGAKCCDPDFVFKGKTRAQYEEHLRGPTAAFIAAMEKKFGSKDTKACNPEGSSPEMAPLLAAFWGNFMFEGITCVCDPKSRAVCKSFVKDVKDPSKGEGKGAQCGWADKGEAAAPGGAAAGGAAPAGGKAPQAGAAKEAGTQAAGDAPHAEAPPPIPVSRRPALDAVDAVRAASPGCADPARPDALRDTPECDQAAAVEIAKRIAPEYTAEQAAVYWGWFKTLTVPRARRPSKTRRPSRK